MKKMIFSVFDNKASVYCIPFYQENLGTAIRSFAAALKDQNSLMAQFPEDYGLYQIGVFDDQTGEITAQVPLHVASATSLLR